MTRLIPALAPAFAPVFATVFATVFALAAPAALQAYDGTECKADGNCWQPKPGYPEEVAGSEYDPQHDPMELNRQAESISGMEERNALRVKHFVETGTFVYDVDEIPQE